MREGGGDHRSSAGDPDPEEQGGGQAAIHVLLPRRGEPFNPKSRSILVLGMETLNILERLCAVHNIGSMVGGLSE